MKTETKLFKGLPIQSLWFNVNGTDFSVNCIKVNEWNYEVVDGAHAKSFIHGLYLIETPQ